MSEEFYEHLHWLRYVWKDKRDLESYRYWDRVQPLLQCEAPEIIKAWNDYRIAYRTMTAVLNRVGD